MMTITELLEAHHEALWNRAGRRECACGYEFTSGYSAQLHRAHVAEVLEQRTREREAQAWQKGVDTALNHAILNPDGITLRLEHLDGRPWANPYAEQDAADQNG